MTDENEPWCDFCDMPLGWCVHGRGDALADPKPLLGPIIMAHHNGVCPGCKEEIIADEHMIGMADDKSWYHYGCGR